MKKVLWSICVMLFFFMSAVFYAAYDLTRYAHTAPQATVGAKIILVPKGQGFSTTTDQLFQAGVIEKPIRFRLFARFYGYDRRIKAGEYSLSAAMSPASVLDVLTTGKVVLHRLTVPEGYSYRQIAAAAESAGFCKAADFINLAQDSKLCLRLGVPGDSLEGYLFPDTYLFPRGAGALDIIETMVRRFQSLISAEWQARALQLNLSVHQLTTLASIIEKETGASHERTLISSVFHNRLKRGMRLASDPTVIYGIKDFDGNITRRHLKQKTPYNTYQINGLPPGPIANPGKEALYAALYPRQTAFLYFVSRKDGTHHFSKTIKEHNRAVRKYQLGR